MSWVDQSCNLDDLIIVDDVADPLPIHFEVLDELEGEFFLCIALSLEFKTF